jgi:hypothetical protein
MKNSKTWTGRVFIGSSLDGFIARSDGDINWLIDPPCGGEHVDVDSSHQAESWETFFPRVDHVVMGRGTYEKVLTFDEWPYTGKTVLVLSTTMTEQDDRIAVIRTLHEACDALSEGVRVRSTSTADRSSRLSCATGSSTKSRSATHRSSSGRASHSSAFSNTTCA